MTSRMERVPDVVQVHLVGFFVAALMLSELILEAAVLLLGIVQLREGVAQLESADVELEALDPVGLVGLLLGERGDGEGKLVDDGGLDEVLFGNRFEDLSNGFPERATLFQINSDQLKNRSQMPELFGSTVLDLLKRAFGLERWVIKYDR